MTSKTQVAIRYACDNGLTWCDAFAGDVGKANDHAYTAVQQVEVWTFKSPEYNLAPEGRSICGV